MPIRLLGNYKLILSMACMYNKPILNRKFMRGEAYAKGQGSCCYEWWCR